MPNQAGTVELILRELSKVLASLAQRLQPQAIEALGLRVPESLSNNPQILGSIQGATGAAAELGTTATDLTDAIDAEDTGAIVAAGVATAQKLVELIHALVQVADQIDSLAGSLGGLSAAERNRIQAFASALPRRIIDYLMIDYLEQDYLPAVAILNLIGLIERIDEPGVVGDSSQPPYVRRELHLERMADLFTDPAEHLRLRYGWGDAAFDPTAFFTKLQSLFEAMDIPADIFETGGIKTFEAYVFSLTPNPTPSPDGLDFVIRVPATADVNVDLPSFSVWSSRIDVSARFDAGIPGTVTPPLNIEFQSPSAGFRLDAKARATAQDSTGPMVFFGSADGTRAEAQTIFVEVGVSATVTSTGDASAEPLIGGGIEGAKIVIDLSSGDGFLQSIASDTRIEGNFSLSFRWQPSEGMQFEGSGGVEIAIPTHIDLGPIQFETLYLVLTFGSDPPLKLETSATINAQLGPLFAGVERMGAEALLRFEDDGDGNLGPLDLGFRFKPPNGIALALDAGVVKGGGYLYFDFDKEEYAGALELVFSEFLTLKAIGLVTTRLPDGSKGFSLLIIITAEFGSPIQLGFGFTLNGVGGLLGVNRTMRLEVIAEGVRTGAIESIMFPKDVIENAPRIISDLREFFPPAADIFLIGPMAKLGWGTPTLVSASLGVIIEIPPGNIAILGVLKVALPDEDFALIVLQVNFIGAMEFDKKRIWFFAAMYESRVLFLTIEGEMGLLVAWGDDANFVLSVGGFHPSFNPPPLPFPNPKRVAVNILNESFAKIRVEGYFAVTSNTVQFGARVEVFFGLSAFKIEGHLAFDALFQFSPFYFIISISASLDVKVFGVGLFSVHMRGELEGTSPWHIEGEGSISILFFSIDVPFSHTWGQDEDTTLPPIRVMPLLESEFNKLDNWTAELPSANNLLVSLREIEATEDLVLHPVGTLRVSQRAVPLDLALDKVGNQTPSDVNVVSIDVPDADLQKHRDTQEQFATAQFKSLNDSAKLSSPAYEKQNSGLELSVTGQQLRSDAAAKRVVRYEEIIIDSNFKEHIRKFVVLASNLFSHFLRGNAASRSVLSATYATHKAPIDQKISLQPPLYVVASNADNSALSAEAKFMSQAKANDFLREQVNKDPKLADSLHVIPAAESKEAA
ncbi:MAG: hypothetical protein OES09_07620 [Gammaproteobacteria bacterium]|nr:hypothetical protein [Gammaproteobacteria bacterium]